MEKTPMNTKNPKKKTSKDDLYPKKMPKDYSFIKAVRSDKDYKSNVERRDKNSRKFLKENYATKNEKSILPGQLIIFNYFEPKTKEELKYYDAMPCTIFFNIVDTENGKRVLGFNLHYYPPRWRWRILERVLEIFKPFYKQYWDKNVKSELKYFNYLMLIDQLQKAKLDFGVRMYIPSLMASITPIPVQAWPKASLTEGRFKKMTKEAIMNYWKNWKTGKSTLKKASKEKNPSQQK